MLMDRSDATPATAPPADAVDAVDRTSVVSKVDEEEAGARSAPATRKVDADFDSFRRQSELVARRRYVTPKDFELIRVIGMGAFGKVLQVRNRESKKVFAMKVISKRVLRKKGKGYIENILAEQKILSRVGNYPFVVSMHCSFQTTVKLFIIMDFLAGGELFLRLGREGIFLEKTAAFYLAEIILALDYLHASGVLHRDLKPENILLGSDGHVCLTDFGLAKDFGPGGLNDDEERANTICGTQEYMAPEMIARKGYGRAADYWSLGCIAYEMLSGLPPFSSKEGAKALFSKIMTEKVKMPSGTTAAGCKLLKGLLNRNVLARFGTARSTMFEVGGVAGLKQQDFFAHLSWDQLEHKEVAPPATFAVTDDNDAQHFHEEFTTMTLPRSVVDMSSERFMPRRVQSDAFRGFSFVHDDFLLPPRAEDEVKSYWEAADEDCESVSDCASSKLGEEVLLSEVEPPKRKRPQRKRKKNIPTPAGSKDAFESRTANTTPLGSAVNTPDPSDIGDAADYQESMNVAEAEKGLQELTVSVEADSVKANHLVSTTVDATVQPSLEVESFTSLAPKPNETRQDNGKAKVQSSPQVKSFSPPAKLPVSKPVVQETWQDIGKEKGKKSKPRDKKTTTPSTDRARLSAPSTQTKQPATTTAHSTPNRNQSIRHNHQSSPSVPGRGQAPIKQEPAVPQRPPPPAPSGSSDWRQHSMRGSPQTAKPTVAPKLLPEAIVWPSLSSGQPKKQAPAAATAAAPVLAHPVSGAWAKRAVQR